ncbi:hypothetical protein L209DRAFT_239945 [Thermothelomyces heterothallicus CBS 203.75]
MFHWAVRSSPQCRLRGVRSNGPVKALSIGPRRWTPPSRKGWCIQIAALTVPCDRLPIGAFTWAVRPRGWNRETARCGQGNWRTSAPRRCPCRTTPADPPEGGRGRELDGPTNRRTVRRSSPRSLRVSRLSPQRRRCSTRQWKYVCNDPAAGLSAPTVGRPGFDGLCLSQGGQAGRQARKRAFRAPVRERGI